MKQTNLICLLVAASLASTGFAAATADGGHHCDQHKHSTAATINADQIPPETQTMASRRVKRNAPVDEVAEFATGALIKQKEEDKKKKKSDLVGELVKLILNPVELAKKVAAIFKLDFEKLTAVVGKNLLFGFEATLSPIIVSGQLIEKVFVPDACALKFSCSMGAHLSFIKVHVLKLSSKLIEGTYFVKAFADGIIGRDCEAAYSGCTNNLLNVRKSVRDEAGLPSLESLGSSDQGTSGQQAGGDVLANLVDQQYDRRGPSNKGLLSALGSSV